MTSPHSPTPTTTAQHTGQVVATNGREVAQLREQILRDLNGGFTDLEFVGAGAAATVWRALDLASGREVAIKRLHGEGSAPKAFYAEMRAAFALHHPNIVQVVNLQEAEGARYLILEYCAGSTLRKAIASERNQGRSWPAERVAEIITQIADALAYLHSRGLVHRDLKPDNVLFETSYDKPHGGDATVKVADFGLTRVAKPTSQSAATAQRVSGSPAYMAPEQFAGEYTPASDFYALGVIAYELLHGQRPFLGSVDALAQQHCHAEAEVDSTLEPRWHELFAGLLHKHPKLRVRDANWIRRTLARAASDQRSLRRPTATTGRIEVANDGRLQAVPLGQSLLCIDLAEQCTTALDVTVDAIALTADAQLAYGASGNALLRVAMFDDVDPVRLTRFVDPIRLLAIDASGQWLAVAAGDLLARIRAASPETIDRIDTVRGGRVTNLAWRRNRLLIVEGTVEAQLHLLDPDSQTSVDTPLPGVCWGMQPSSDGSVWVHAIGSDGHGLFRVEPELRELEQIATPRPIRCLGREIGSPNALIVCDDGSVWQVATNGDATPLSEPASRRAAGVIGAIKYDDTITFVHGTHRLAVTQARVGAH